MPIRTIIKPYVIRRDYYIMHFPTGKALINDNGLLTVSIKDVGVVVYPPDGYIAVTDDPPGVFGSIEFPYGGPQLPFTEDEGEEEEEGTIEFADDEA